jgi:hypothetical protein
MILLLPLLWCRRYRRYRWTRVHPSVMLAFAGGDSRLESQETIPKLGEGL